MLDFPISELMDDTACLGWLERHLHPEGLNCPRCGSTNRRLFRATQAFPAYRCRQCDGYYTILTDTAFEKTRQRPATLVLLLRGVAQGETTARYFRGVHKAYLACYLAVYEAVRNAKRITSGIVQRLCFGTRLHAS
jgi:transposase-like protein